MAVDFSEDEKEKLLNDDSEIYKKRTKESENEERKNQTLRQKIANFRYYYLNIILVVAVIAIMAGLQIKDYMTKDKTRLFITVEKDVLDDKVIEELEDELTKYLKYDGRDKVKIVQQSDTMQVQANLYSGAADILIASREDFAEWATSDYFYIYGKSDLVDFYGKYDKKYRYYSQIITGEDVRKNLKNTVITPGDKTEYFMGLSLKDSEKYKQIGGMLNDPIIAINVSGKNGEDAADIVKLFMDNSKKIKTKSKYYKKSPA